MVERFPLIFLFVSHLFISEVMSRNFTIENKCNFTVWPGVISDNMELSTSGFVLRKGEARVINAPSSWNGRFWGRSICSTNSTGYFSCATGDCGSGKIECSGAVPKPPITLAEFSLDGINGNDFYDVSLVDGYNLPLVIVPQHPQSGQTCRTIGCVVDLNKTCPSELEVKGNSSEEQVIGCMSACHAFNSDRYCCRGNYSTASTCPPDVLHAVFQE